MKKWLITTVCLLCCLLLGVGTVNFLVDPLMQYRPLPSALSFVAYDYDYINPGVAKNSQYDAVLVGTSLAENTDVDYYETLFDCKMIKLIYPGGTSKNNTEILNAAYRTHALQRVLWCMDDTFFFNTGEEFSHDLPMYLYDTDKWNDVNYLFNLSIFYNYTVKDILNTVLGVQSAPLLRGNIWSDDKKFGKESVMRYWDPETKPRPAEPIDYYQKNVEDNLQRNVLPLIEAHPETEFCFFFPPKCITYWYKAMCDGLLDAKFYSMRYTVQALLQQPNVRVFFYPDRMEWTTDFSLYTDNIHFKCEINSQIGEAMARGEGELTAQNCVQVLDACLAQLKALDYSVVSDA